MANRTLTVNSVIIYDEQEGRYRQFFKGDEFDPATEDHLISQLGDHCFAPQEEEEDAQVDLHDMTVKQLVSVAKELGIEAHSNKKADLIAAIEQYMSANEE